ncbi:MAG TPA: hypothetical protein VN408_26495 [Actinoplanes sp.]|nr:hypothetical protein [Actinoplanes sp.]
MRLLPLIAGAALAGSLAGTAPAAAAVTFDFTTNLGSVDAADLLQGFDWNATRLAREAPAMAFHHSMLIEETWWLTCKPGARPFKAIRVQQDMKVFLTSTPAYSPGRKKVTGFRITGSNAAISATTAGFAVGYPCPESGQGPAIKTLRKVADTTTRTLSAEAGDRTAPLFQTRTGPPTS